MNVMSLVLAAAVAGAGAPERVTAVPGQQYEAGWLHRLLLGAHHRDLWTSPLRVPVLDLDSFAGGLKLLGRAGRGQTRSLRFEGQDGRIYSVRSVDKDPQALLSPELRATFVARVLQDQMSVGHPAGALIATPLLAAAGVLHAVPQLCVVPDDARLGDMRGDFAGMLGLIEERPQGVEDDRPAFAGAEEVVTTEKLLEHLEHSPTHRVDTRAYLDARLMDIFLGDWDRHMAQWRWARFDRDGVHFWVPIPRDRDQAFSRLDGVLLWLAGFSNPELVGFGEEYPAIWRLTWSGRHLDRRLLAGLDRAAFRERAEALRDRLTETVLVQAAGALPPEYASGAPALVRALRSRRERLVAAADTIYLWLAREVDMHATDTAEDAEIERRADGSVLVRVSRRRDSEAGGPFLERVFHPDETSEVRLYLHGGDDRARVFGTATRGLLVRVIGGGGDDLLVDESRVETGGVATRFYDAKWAPPQPDTQASRLGAIGFTAGDPPRDWGHRLWPAPVLGFDADLGLFVGASLALERYGFRTVPYGQRHTLSFGYATGVSGLKAEYTADLRAEARRPYLRLQARVSQVEILRYQGLGNEAPAPEDPDQATVRLDQYRLQAALVQPLGRRAELTFGARFQATDTGRTRPDAYVAVARPYGAGVFSQLSLIASAQIDRRDRPTAASRGFLVNAGGSLSPAVADARSTFGEAHGQASAYWTPGEGPATLALRIGGRHVWGRYPFQESAFLGGAETLRGYSEQRFAGDAALWGNAELRLRLARFFLLLPGELGAFALADLGRVFVDGERSERWHPAWGGGIWLAFLNPLNTLSAAVVRGRERTTVHVRAGFQF